MLSTPTGTRTRNLVLIRHETVYKAAALTIELWGHIQIEARFLSGIEPQTGVEPASSITVHRVEAYTGTGALIFVVIQVNTRRKSSRLLEFEPVTGVEPASSNYCLTD